ncbi:MAG: DNA-binding response regulator [Deltaproteobacteria bacterium HGW-Deltaproteobacteria-14]|nr:MAG: DNA-binding response regulator [Deltaproteobacteria bacterium HGW-Deltaproteobacteria-14]
MGEHPTLLVVEDDRTLARGLVMNLEIEGFRVLHAADGEEGLRIAIDEAPDLVILDLMLPGMDGFEVVAALRERARATPVLVLSARGEVADKVEALHLGADGYLTKPFSLAELVARVRAALRRPAWDATHDRVVRFGDVTVALDRGEVHRAGAPVSLTAREVELLAFLVSHPGRIYSRSRLLDAVWDYDYDGTTRTIDNFIRRLRVKLEVDARRPRHLVTVHGAGYRFDP